MATKGGVPVADASLLSYMTTFAAKIEAYGSILAITKDDIAALKADAAMVSWILATLPSLRASAQQYTAFKDNLFDGATGAPPLLVPTAPTVAAAPTAVPAGILSRTRALVQRIKKSPGYTEAIGKDLGIVSTATLALETPKPTFKATALPGSDVRLDWVKGGHSGVTIQAKRTGDADWVALGRDNYSPFNDARAPLQAGTNETRQYRMRYLDKDEEVGEWSDIVTVVTIA